MGKKPANHGKPKPQTTEQEISQSSSPLIFISHDSRDAKLAEAFSELLGGISSGMLKFFRSSDKKGKGGIEFGDEWYKRVMTKLGDASDVVCLITERSLERPWILYEAGVAKSNPNTRVFGVALGVSLNDASTGPFYQFQNCDDTEEDLTKLVLQLSERVQGMKPVDSVVKSQVEIFKSSVDEILTKFAGSGTEAEEELPSIGTTAKLLEELKLMLRHIPSHIDEVLSENTGISRNRKRRRFHPMMLEEMAHMGRGEPLMILVFASLVRDDVPWLCEIAMEAYRAITSGTQKSVEQIRQSIKMLREFSMRNPMFEELIDSKESHMIMMEGPHILERMVMMCSKNRKRR